MTSSMGNFLDFLAFGLVTLLGLGPEDGPAADSSW